MCSSSTSTIIISSSISSISSNGSISIISSIFFLIPQNFKGMSRWYFQAFWFSNNYVRKKNLGL